MVPQQTTLTGVDLFAGAGGFSLAAHNAGLRIVAAIELDKHACATYRKNFIEGVAQPPYLVEGDIGEINWPKFFRDSAVEPGKCDVVIGGPPCQGFSAHRINDAGVGDPRNSLLLTYFDCMRKIRPRGFIVENVCGLLWARHKSYLERFVALANETGYDVLGPTVLNARDFGVPQNRKRVFLVGVRRDVCVQVEWPPCPTHFDPQSDDVLLHLKSSWVTASTVFEKPLRTDDVNRFHMVSGESLMKVFRSTPLNGGSRKDSIRVLPCHSDHNGHKDVYGRIDPFKPGPTMTTACINPSKGRFLHPVEHHGISARHAARFQMFPDTFQFHGGLIASGIQIGNAVPVTLGELVIRSIVRALQVCKTSSHLPLTKS